MLKKCIEFYVYAFMQGTQFTSNHQFIDIYGEYRFFGLTCPLKQ